jgi:UDP-N-acetylglucosamine transferase subunit ALG13
MILVTVGNATQGFPRLLDAVDRIAGEGAFGGDAILVQSGHTRDFRPRHCRHQAFFPMEEFIALVHEASLVIAHAGAGTLFHVFGAGKIPVVMPRRRQYGEHVDDHQVELVRALSAEGRVVPAYDAADMSGAVGEARRRAVRHRAASRPRMLALVTEAIEGLLETGPS